MFEKLKDLSENSYAPYSNFIVASIIVYEDGTIFKGVNVENISFGGTICAERNAISNAISQGKKNINIKEVHIYAKNLNSSSNDESDKIQGSFTPPCGLCRQFISEFATEKTIIVMWNDDGEKKEILFSDIFPMAFKSKYLGKQI